MGGWTKRDVNSDSIKEWANKAVTKFNQQNNDMHQHVVTNIVSAHSQVVAGAKYKLRVEFGRTNCKKGDVCGDNEPVESKKNYEIDIFSQPWTNTEEITFKEI
ncbi:Cystatin domain-containing protein [Aphelenchoides bicaudatus]|nr:Cystatin domain-containing protein [Aphelenchoides bicaudatus]